MTNVMAKLNQSNLLVKLSFVGMVLCSIGMVIIQVIK